MLHVCLYSLYSAWDHAVVHVGEKNIVFKSNVALNATKGGKGLMVDYEQRDLEHVLRPADVEQHAIDVPLRSFLCSWRQV